MALFDIQDAQVFVLNRRSYIEDRLQQFCTLTGYHIHRTQFYRKLCPNSGCQQEMVRGTEVFVTGFPNDLLEDDLFKVFSEIGEIAELRLMITPSGLCNRHFAFVRYYEPWRAKQAIEKCHNFEIRNGLPLRVFLSVDKNRLCLNGIAHERTALEILQELKDKGMVSALNVVHLSSGSRYVKKNNSTYVEFQDHKSAADAKRIFRKKLNLFGKSIKIRWADISSYVKPQTPDEHSRIYIRNLNPYMTTLQLATIMSQVVDLVQVENIYHRFNFSLIYFSTRKQAEAAMPKLRELFGLVNDKIDVLWAKPKRKRTHTKRSAFGSRSFPRRN